MRYGEAQSMRGDSNTCREGNQLETSIVVSVVCANSIAVLYVSIFGGVV